MSILEIALRTLIGVVFAWAAGSKVRNRAALRDFADSLDDFGVPWSWARPTLAGLIACTEAMIVVLMLISPALGFVLASALLLMFTAAIARLVMRRAIVSCRCFGSPGSQLGMAHIVRNGLLLLASGTGVSLEIVLAPQPLELPVKGFAVAVGLLFASVIVRWDDIVFLLRGAPRPASSPHSNGERSW
jgi:hypothetical protein